MNPCALFWVMLGWVLLDLSTGGHSNWAWVLKRSCFMIWMCFLPQVVQLFAVFSNSFLNGSWSSYATCQGGAWCSFRPSLAYNDYVPLKHPIPEKQNIIIIYVHFLCYFCSCCHVSFLSRACSKIVNFHLFCMAIRLAFESWFIHDLTCLECLLISPFFWLASSIVQFMLKILIAHSLASVDVLGHFWVLQRNYIVILYLCA